MRTRDYAYVIRDVRERKQAGGSDYTIAVYYLDPVDGPIGIGSHRACTSSHLGERSEAWVHVAPHLPPAYAKHYKGEYADTGYGVHPKAPVRMTRLG